MNMWGNVLMVLKVCMGKMIFRKHMQKEEDCWSSVVKESCGWQTLGLKDGQKKITHSAGVCETEIDFVLVGKYRKYGRDVKVISGKHQLRLVVIDQNKKVLKRIVRKKPIHNNKDVKAE